MGASSRCSPTTSGFAFLVDASDYGEEVVDLPKARDEVEALAERLVEIGFDEKNVEVLINGGDFSDYPTKANIERRFHRFVDALEPGDFAFVYLSGRGFQPADSNEAFFVPVDFETNDPVETSVSLDRMLAKLNSGKASFNWAIVDACRENGAGAGGKGTKGLTVPANVAESSGAKTSPRKFLNVSDEGRFAVLSSCARGEATYEDEDGGFFARSLLEALDPTNPKPNANGDEALTFSEAVAYVAQRTNELARKKRGVSQVLVLNGEIVDFVVWEKAKIDALSNKR